MRIQKADEDEGCITGETEVKRVNPVMGIAEWVTRRSCFVYTL